MKKIILLKCLFIIQLYFCQVGIKTGNPLGTFHIDGNKDNPTNGSPSSSAAMNDFIVNSSGNVGIGVVAPENNLQIIGNTINDPVRVAKTLSLSSSNNHLEQLGIDVQGNVGIRSSVSVIASVFTVPSQVRGLDQSKSGKNVNIPLSESYLVYNTLSANIGTDTYDGETFNYMKIPDTGAYEIQVVGAFNCSTAGIWGTNLQIRKGTTTGNTVSYSILETRRIASTFVATTQAVPGRAYGIFNFSAGDRVNFRLNSGKTYISSTTPDCGSVNVSGPTSGLKIIITKVG